MDHLIIVTGGSAGIGHALLATAPQPSHRITVSRRPADTVASGFIEADLADPASWSRVGDVVDAVATEREWQRITLFQAAGTLSPIGFAGEVDPAAYEANILLNAAAPQAVGHRFLGAVSHLRCRRELVMVSSGAARKDYPGWSSYGAAKAATDRWVSTVGTEQRERGGVHVLSVAPGVVATGMQELIRDTDARSFPQVDRFRRFYDEGALEEPETVARAMWALLDDTTVASGAVLDLRDLRS